MLVHELSGCGFQSRCSHVNFHEVSNLNRRIEKKGSENKGFEKKGFTLLILLRILLSGGAKCDVFYLLPGCTANFGLLSRVTINLITVDQLEGHPEPRKEAVRFEPGTFCF